MNKNKYWCRSTIIAIAFISLTAGSLLPSYADQSAAPKALASDSTKAPVATTGAADKIADATSADDESQDPIPQSQPTKISDPYQWFNRPVFKFNDTLDIYFLKPIATVYNAIVPKPLNKGIHNVFNNIDTLPTIANDILQFNFYQMANDVWRVLINTTIGVGGLFDVAQRMGLPFYANDFGLTLAHWGYKQSNYLVLPFFGSYTVRDSLGLPVDYYGFSIYPYINPDSTRYEIYALAVVDQRAQLLNFQPIYEEAAYDKYIFVRNAYLQRRAHKVEENSHLSAADHLKNQACT